VAAFENIGDIVRPPIGLHPSFKSHTAGRSNRTPDFELVIVRPGGACRRTGYCAR
jgi:hypothetical protein